MRLREATADDAPRVIEMAERFLRESPYGPLFGDRATPEAIGTLVVNVLVLGVIIVAELDVDDPRWEQGAGPHSRLVGMLAIVALPHPLAGGKVAEELAWWVEPEHRKGLIGPKMLRAAEEWATRNGANMVKMVAPAGSTVGAFYERAGFRAVETAFIKSI